MQKTEIGGMDVDSRFCSLHFGFTVKSFFFWIKTLFFRTKQGPFWCFKSIVESIKLFFSITIIITFNKGDEFIEINPCMPFSVYFEFFLSDQDTI
uniref:Uncharacterized protein n=1 Tax=Tetranychus urticae TaxID=32264 RepID=T1K7J4_TETUR